MGVSVTYNLKGAGWSECLVEIGEQHIHLFASYVSDALGSLLDAAIGLMLGRDKMTAIFAEEPGEYRWQFHLVGTDRVRVRILWFTDTFSRKPDEQGEILFDAECRLRTFAGAVLSASQRVIAEHGLVGYREQWVNHDFPLGLQERLKHLLDSR